MLQLSNLSVSYDGSRILREVNLAVSPGRVICLMGRNGVGVGKSTTLSSTLLNYFLRKTELYYLTQQRNRRKI